MNISESCFYEIPSPTYNRYLFDFEKNFDYWPMYFWFVENWKICYYFIAIYLVAIFTGQHLMKSRKPYKLRGLLFFWNLTLALFSTVASLRVIPELYYMLRTYSFHDNICDPGPKQHKQAASVWAYLFTISKVLELGDTVFIVLRKKPLIFLHWYHHISVLLFAWGSSAYPSVIHGHYCIINLFVHSCMYSYYALKALRFKIPRSISIFVTSLQLVQMIVGVLIAVFAYRAKSQNPDCCVFDQAINIAAAIYASYFLLFLRFFIKAYFTKNVTLFDENGSIKKIM